MEEGARDEYRPVDDTARMGSGPSDVKAAALPGMNLRLAGVTLLVREYNEAIEWFQTRLGFEVLEDAPLGDGKRWV